MFKIQEQDQIRIDPWTLKGSKNVHLNIVIFKKTNAQFIVL